MVVQLPLTIHVIQVSHGIYTLYILCIYTKSTDSMMISIIMPSCILIHKAVQDERTMDNLFTGNKQLPHMASQHPYTVRGSAIHYIRTALAPYVPV